MSIGLVRCLVVGGWGAFFGLIPGLTLAGTLAVIGNLQPGAPKMPVVYVTPPLCAGRGSTLVTYRVYPLTVSVTGSYTFDLSYPSGNASFYLYEGSFDPANGTAHCVQAANVAPKQLVFTASAANAYNLVVVDDTLGQTSGSFSVNISGPGNISQSNGEQLEPVPTLSPALGGLLSLCLALIGMRRRRDGPRD